MMARFSKKPVAATLVAFIATLFVTSGCRSNLKATTTKGAPLAATNLDDPFLGISGDIVATSSDAAVVWKADANAESYEVILAKDIECKQTTYLLPSVENKVVLDGVADGIYYVCLRGITGKNKLLNTATLPPRLVVDRILPISFAIKAPSSVVSQSQPTIQWNRSDADVSYKVVVGAGTCATPVVSTTTSSLDWSVSSPLEDGSYVACVTAVDAVGHETIASNSPYAFAVDTVPPGSFSITSNPPNFTANAEPSMTLSVSTGAASYKIFAATDSNCITAANSEKTLIAPTVTGTLHTLTANTYFACAAAIDAAGNTTAAGNNGIKFSYFSAIAIGQPSLTSVTPNAGGISAGRIKSGGAVWSDGTKLAVADAANNRVLLWDQMPRYSGAPADRVLGQPDMTSSAANMPSRSGSTLSSPYGVMYDGARLIVADYSNRRVLIWTGWPTINQQPANFVVGQTSDTVAVSATSQTALKSPAGVWSDGTNLLVADDSDRRVVLFKISALMPFATPAFAVLGQLNYTSNTSYGATQSSHSDSSGVWSDNSRIIVADSNLNRVVIYTSIPAPGTFKPNAAIVLGQPNFTTATANTNGLSASSLNYPIGVSVVGNKLFVAERTNNRVLVWNDLNGLIAAGMNAPPAEAVYGQPDFFSNATNNFGYAAGLNSPQSVGATSDLLFVPELNNARVKMIPLN